jgi:uncharacterized membrane protein
MFGRSKTVVREQAAIVSELATLLARDKRFRRQLLGAARHGSRAKRRAVRQIGVLSVAGRLAADAELRDEVQKMTGDLQAAWNTLQTRRHRSHMLRNALVLAGAGVAVGAALRTRGRLTSAAGDNTSPRTIEATIEVDVPVSTAYNQWTQFEEFPRFMQGVEEVRQLDDTRLHWVASVGGRRAEWDAKILEQHPDRQISWISEDGKKTRGTVTFEERAPSRTLIRLSMSYQAEGPIEAVGSTAGLDERRVRGDLERFKEFIESRGAETDAWRGEISAGRTQT